VCHGQWVEVSKVKEEQARGQSHDEGDAGEDGIGQVRDGEDGRRSQRGEMCAVDETAEAAKEEVLQQKLLDEGPEGVSPVAFEECDGAGHGVQRLEVARWNDADG
jgi:hypothetical protein